ncbi:MAG: hypothetical protein IKK11_03690 [Oscillospiraceae bacterium]|nr:hypothetical protein [Oscillospiraceae bacterium]
METAEKTKERESVPLRRAHKPIYAINGYAAVDGYYKNDTDAVGISVGKAQWDKKNVIPSVKVWRYKGKWSRQSEETTFTRALDMAMLVIKVLDKHYHGKDFETVNSIYGVLKVDEIECDPAIKEEFGAFLNENKKDIDAHIHILHSALESYLGKP